MSREISEDELKIAKERLKAMPAHVEISIGGKGDFSKEELKGHLEDRDEVGQTFAKMQMAGLRQFKEI